MAEKEIKKSELEREYVIPLRVRWKNVPRYKRANKAIKAIKEFLVRHMTIRDRDLNKIKIDRYLNEYVWFRGIKKPPAKVKVKVVKKGDIVTAELFEFPTKLKFKKAREEKVEKEGEKIMKKKKEEKKEEEKTETKSPEEEKKEEEKKAAVVEAGKERAKQAAKKIKHQAGGKTKQPKRQQRKALAK